MSYDQQKIVEAVRAFENGEIVVVMDDDDRENEGDLIVSAVHCTPEKMAFIIRHTSGIVCAPMTVEDARRLNLAPMVAENDAPHATAFTVSVDYRHDTTTGISAEERTSTVRALANPNSGAFDFVSKPLDLNRMLITVRNAMDKSSLIVETKVLKRRVSKSKTQNLA